MVNTAFGQPKARICPKFYLGSPVLCLTCTRITSTVVWNKFSLLLTSNLTPLGDYKLQDIKDSIESLKGCNEKILDIKDSLNLLKLQKSDKLNKTFVDLINTKIDEIEESKGYESFLSIFTLTFEEPHAVGNPDLKGVISFIEEKHAPSLPWSYFYKKYLYKDEIEYEYQDLTPESFNKKVNVDSEALYEIEINPINEVVNNNIKNGIYGPRAQEIYDLWISLKLNESFGEKDCISFKDPVTKETIKEQEFKKAIKTVEEYLRTYYKKILIQQKKLKNLPKYVDPNAPEWMTLINIAQTFKFELINLKKEFKKELIKYDYENTDFLMEDIRSLVIDNNLKPLEFPTVRNMQSLPGGAGLVKRCNELREGNKKGMQVARDKYIKYIVKCPINPIKKLEEDPTIKVEEEPKTF